MHTTGHASLLPRACLRCRCCLHRRRLACPRFPVPPQQPSGLAAACTRPCEMRSRAFGTPGCKGKQGDHGNTGVEQPHPGDRQHTLQACTACVGWWRGRPPELQLCSATGTAISHIGSAAFRFCGDVCPTPTCSSRPSHRGRRAAPRRPAAASRHMRRSPGLAGCVPGLQGRREAAAADGRFAGAKKHCVNPPPLYDARLPTSLQAFKQPTNLFSPSLPSTSIM